MQEITGLQPSFVWIYFKEILAIPRISKKEEKIITYLVDFAKEHKLAYKSDQVGNLLISTNIFSLFLFEFAGFVCL